MQHINKFIAGLFILCAVTLSAQKDKDKEKTEKKDTIGAEITGALKWRAIGPAYASGRIADFAVNPANKSEYYVAVASGNVWKTTNSGTTFEPVFDEQGAYATSCVAIDPNNPYTVWVGTGENNHQRALGYGDGVYKSTDGGKTWKNMGLKDSRQIGGIVVDPRNSNNVFVAAEGSVWGPGGDRGLYKSTDGGKTWKKTLSVSEHTGVNNIAYDFRNPDVMYATTEQRRRHVFTKIGGGPESAVYKSTDAGETWEKIMNGLPGVDIGGMGIAVSPANPDVIYLIVEAALKKGGFFRSTNRGASWEKMSDHTEAGQYYNEIYCDPKNADKVYSVETVSQVTLDGGKTWKPIGNNRRHVDDHALWIDPANTRHYLIGGDGGIYETYDEGATFHFKDNLPVTQFYRVNVDDALPFYNIYGGTQDNNSMGGPSRTIYADGILNSDWYVTNGGDGFWTAIEPGNPDIAYAEAQYGNMVRYDKKSGEMLGIRPEPGKGELTYRWNWNTPLFISPHSKTRLYCAANKVFRTDDRGDTWTAVSEDLTAQIDRNTWKVMDKYWSSDAVAKDRSTSQYGTIVSLCESPVRENLLFAGTDDGLIQVSEDAKTWRRVSAFPGIPENTYVSDICASKFDENVVFASFDNILRDDFKPYILKSADKGKTWKSISGNLPSAGTVHSIEQDFVNPDLLFAGTEFGFFCSTDGGEKWFALKSGLPTISVRDIAIQKRESDLVIATFGRGFYVLDDYSCLRGLNKETLEKNAVMFPVREADSYIQGYRGKALGSSLFVAPNPEFGAAFTFYVKDVPKTLADERREKEKELFKKGEKIPQPTAEQSLEEEREIAPYFILTVKDANGTVVRKMTKAAAKGLHRLTWDLQFHSTAPVTQPEKFNPLAKQNSYALVAPGDYTVSLALMGRSGLTELAGPAPFKVTALTNTTLPAARRTDVAAFMKDALEMARSVQGAQAFVTRTLQQLDMMKQAMLNTAEVPHTMLTEADGLIRKYDDILLKFQRRSSRPSAEENPPSQVTFSERVEALVYNHSNSTSRITGVEQTAYNVLSEEFPPVLEQIRKLYTEEVEPLGRKMETFGAPFTPGRLPELKIKK